MSLFINKSSRGSSGVVNGTLPVLEYVINSTEELPNSFDQDNMCYIFGNTGIVIPDGGIEITGDNIRVTAFNPYLEVVYNGTGAMFFGIDHNVSFDEFSPQAPTGILFNFSDTVGGHGFFAKNLQNINCRTLGIIHNFEVVLFDLIKSTSVGVNANQGLVFSGTEGLVKSLTRVAFITDSPTYIAIDLGASITQLVDIDRPTVNGPVGAVGLAGLPLSGNILSGGIGRFQAATLSGGVTLSSIIDPQDIRWKFKDNPGMERSRTDCELFFLGGTSDTVITSGVGSWHEISTPSVGTWGSTIANRFTVDTTTGVMTYIGEETIDVSVTSTVVLSKSGGGADTLECRIAKNWVGLPTDGGTLKTRDRTENSTPTSIHPGGLITLSTNDNLRLIFSNQDGVSNIVVDVAHYHVSGGD